MSQTRAFTSNDREEIVRLLGRLPGRGMAEQLPTASALAWIGIRARKRDSAVRGRLSSPARGRVGAVFFLPVLEAFQSLPIPVRCEVALALGDLAGGSAVAELARLVTSSNAEARLTAVDALGKIGGPEAVESLMASAGDINETVRAEAVRALGQLAVAEEASDVQGMAPVETLCLEMSAGDPSEYVREVAAEALTAIRGTKLRQPHTLVDCTPSPAVSIPV